MNDNSGSRTGKIKNSISTLRELSRVATHVLGGVTKAMDLAHETVEDIQSGLDIERRHNQKVRQIQREKSSGGSRKKTLSPPRAPRILNAEAVYVKSEGTTEHESKPKSSQPTTTRKKATQKPTAKVKTPAGVKKTPSKSKAGDK
jgi:hypothetical protein